ncbi:MAG: orotidine 5'-phosphate decarboxylase [Spirochaetaceae bacterium]|nr:orotidine 5'-phosphate decarboxylase [Spirochaetaceae bacterium]
MELQLALDMISFEKGLAIARDLKDLIDVLELGTPFSFVNPISVIRHFKDNLPGVKILSDFKIMDGGYIMSKLAFDAGADIVTVSGRTWDITIQEAITAAKERGKLIHVDMMGVPDDQLENRCGKLDSFQPAYIGIHRAVSIKESSPECSLRLARNMVKNAKLAVAGGINCETLRRIMPFKPDLVIVGTAITSAGDPRGAALEIRDIMEG